MTDKMAFVCDEVTPEMIALDELLATDDLTGVCPVGLDEEQWVEITREITVDPAKYRSSNYQPDPNTIPANEPDPDDDENDDLPPDVYGQDEAVALDALPCNTPFGNCQAKNPLLCPYHGAKLIEADIKAGLAQTIPNAIVSVKAQKASQARGKNFSISIKVPASQKLAAEKALDDFLQQPGIKGQGMKDWDPRSNEWSDFYDVDLLQLNNAPQGGMANRAALANSVGQSLNPQQPSQQQSPASAPASQTAAPAQTPPPVQPAQPAQSAQPAQAQQSTGTKAKNGQLFATANKTSQAMMPTPANGAGAFGVSLPFISSITNTLGISGTALTWNKGFTKMNVGCPNPTVQQGQALQDALGDSWEVKVNGTKGFTVVPAQPAPAAAKATSQTSSSSSGQQPLAGGYQPLSDVADDRKFMTSMKGKAGEDELQDLEDLIDEKEQLMEQIDATKMAMSNGDPKDAQMYQGILDYAAGGLKDVDEKVLEAKEALSNKYDSKECQPIGADCSKIKANLQAQGATFIPKALDGLDNVMKTKLAACQQSFINAGLTEASNPATWAKIQELVSASLANYLTKAAIRSYTSGDSPDAYFFSDSKGKYGNLSRPGSYYNDYGDDLMTDNYGIANPALREFRLCASATDPDKSAWASGQSDWTYGGCAFTIRKSNTFCSFIDFNTGGTYSRSYNSSPISKPSILSLGHKPSSYVSWIRTMLQTGKPDLTYGRAKEQQLVHNGHNEVHAFCGCDKTSKSEPILAHIERLEYEAQSDAQTVVAKHAKELKSYDVKVFYYDRTTGKNVEVQF